MNVHDVNEGTFQRDTRAQGYLGKLWTNWKVLVTRWRRHGMGELVFFFFLFLSPSFWKVKETTTHCCLATVEDRHTVSVQEITSLCFMRGLVSPDLTSSSALYNKTEESILGYPHEELLSLCFKPVWVIWRCLRTRKMVHNQRTNDDAKSTLQGITSLCFKRGLSSKRTQFHIRGPPWPPNKELYRSKMFVRIRYDILGILIR